MDFDDAARLDAGQVQDARGWRTVVEALSVSFAPATDAEFTPPADYERVAAGQQGPRP